MSDASSIIKIGVIGTGLIAREHAAAIAMTGGRMKLVAAGDISADRLVRFSEDFGVVTRYKDAAGLIADPQIDLVVVATPPSSHETHVVAALDQGKYVLCEKPLAHSLASARRIVQAEVRNSGRLSVGYQFRYDPAFRRLAWLVRQGWIGGVRSALVDRHGSLPNGASGWWGAWDVAGGGALITQMIHELDLLIQIMGMPQSVMAMADTRFAAIESEDCLEAALTFADGRNARCTVSVNSGTRGGGITLKGDNGTASLSGYIDLFDEGRQAEAAKAADAAVPLSSPYRIGAVLGPMLRRLGIKSRPALTLHARFYRDIAYSIGRHMPLPMPAADAIASLEVCVAAYESVVTGKEILLPLSSKSRVYEGVRRQDYEGRKCDRNWPAVFIPHPPPPPGPKKLVKHALSVVGLDPGVIKASIRRAAPVHGGPKTRIRSWPRRRTFGHLEKRAVMRLMDREIRYGDAIGYNGVEERAYCEAFANYLGGGYADAVNSGTNAIYVALKALDLEPGSEVIVSPVTDPGGIMPVAVMNCIPVVADAAPGSILVSADQIRAVLTKRTSAIIVAHIAGHAVDLDPIVALAAEQGVFVVEDCAQAHGTLYKGQMVGTAGDIAAFSTMVQKNHSTGGQGGVVFTRNQGLFVRARQVADRGKPFGALGVTGNVLASLNFNQDEISMAIGRVQLAKLPAQIAARRAFAAIVEASLVGIEEVSLLADPPHCTSSYHFLMFRLDVDRLGCTVEQFAQGLSEDGIGGVGAYAVYPTDHPWYRNAAVFGTSGLPWSARPEAPTPQYFGLPNAREATRTLLRVDLHQGMGPAEARDLVAAIRKAIRWYGGRA